MKTQILQRLYFASTAMGLMLGALATSANAGEVNTGYFGDVAIKGYDPVAYFTDGKAVRGSEAFSYKWLSATWYFSNDDHRRLFMASPISYAPQYGGLCAEGVAAHGEATVNIEPESWQIIDGKLYISAAASFQDRPLDVAAAEGKWPSAHAKLAQ
jgi:YHS domain-containing protein